MNKLKPDNATEMFTAELSRSGLVLFWVLVLCLTLAGCSDNVGQESTRYITWDGLEPDKWASIWLIKRHLAPDAEVLIRPVGAPVGDGIAFGVPSADYRRSHGVSIYESLLQGYQVRDPALLRIG